MIVALRQCAALSKRAIITARREPTAIIPPLVFPLMFLGMTAAALTKSTDLPGFPPVDSFVQFGVAATIVQGALFGAMSAGAAMAVDIEKGFFERLIASPAARTSILVGRLAASALVGFAQAWLFFGVTRLFGVEIETGLQGMLAISLVAAVLAAGIGAITVTFALQTGSSEAVQGMFPLIFVFLFLSSAFFPRNLMDGWFKSAATINPLSHMIEGLRTLVIDRFDVQAFWAALSIAGAILVLGVLMSGVALRRRLASAA